MTLKKIIGHEKLYELISQQFLLTAALIALQPSYFREGPEYTGVIYQPYHTEQIYNEL